MAYNELIKNFDKIRGYMRQFYIYGFRSRTEYDMKSARSYDNERRRIESWLGDYISFRHDPSGKSVFLSVDSRRVKANPLYKALKARSFTSGDITFHFYVLDILAEGDSLSLGSIMDRLSSRLSLFEDAPLPDESTVRKKLKEYVSLGILRAEKRGRECFYSRNEDLVDLDSWQEAVSFFSEQSPLGAVGSFILDKYDSAPDYFSFKHHYIMHAIDSSILYSLLLAIDEGRLADITLHVSKTGRIQQHTVFPLKIFISTQSGRQYLLCRTVRGGRYVFHRIDAIDSVKAGEVYPDAEASREYCKQFMEHQWGVSTANAHIPDRIELTIHVGDGEGFIIDRLYREKRCGSVTQLGKNTYLYTAEVYDATELLPWIRTFTGRIKCFYSSNDAAVRRFYADMKLLTEMYGGDGDALQ